MGCLLTPEDGGKSKAVIRPIVAAAQARFKKTKQPKTGTSPSRLTNGVATSRLRVMILTNGPFIRRGNWVYWFASHAKVGMHAENCR